MKGNEAMRRKIFTLLKSRPLMAKEVAEKLQEPRNHVFANLEIMAEEGLLKKKMLAWDGLGLVTYYGWPKKKEGKL